MADLNLMSVVRLSGLSEHVIRAWERRYQAVSPRRGPNGRRLYSQEDLHRLQLLSRLVSQGHSIGNIAKLSTQNLEELQATSFAPLLSPKKPSGLESDRPQEGIDKILSAVRAFDMTGLDRELRAAHFQLGTKIFTLNVASPLLAEIGSRVEAGDLSIAQEHALSATVRNLLGEILRSLQNRSDALSEKAVVLSTPEDDLHEFGILLSAILFAAYGWETHYLGPNLPAKDLAQAVSALRVPVVVLGCTAIPASEQQLPVLDYLRELDLGLKNGKAEIWLGGSGIPESWEPSSGRKWRTLESLHELEQILESHSF